MGSLFGREKWGHKPYLRRFTPPDLIGNLLRHGAEAQAEGQRGAAIAGTMKRRLGMIHSGQDSALPSNK
jgi:hypothetical protein